ncbi:hypothetical protein [[Phormidium ambiguum] IAM M-71]|nr:hypothetical protein [Phormidium ambiguum]
MPSQEKHLPFKLLLMVLLIIPQGDRKSLHSQQITIYCRRSQF